MRQGNCFSGVILVNWYVLPGVWSNTSQVSHLSVNIGVGFVGCDHSTEIRKGRLLWRHKMFSSQRSDDNKCLLNWIFCALSNGPRLHSTFMMPKNQGM